MSVIYTDEYLARMDAIDVSSVTLAIEEVEPVSATETETEQALATAWEATLLVEGEPTEDGRMLELGSISWRDLPLTLMAMTETGPGGHEGAEVAGRIDLIRRDGARITAGGEFDTGEYGSEIARLVADRTLRGVSVDLAILDSEVRDAETGEVLDVEQQMEYWMEDKPMLFVVTDGVIGAATVCPFQAIEQADISVVASGRERERFIANAPTNEHGLQTMTLWVPFGLSGLTASAVGEAPVNPPVDWFDDPLLDRPTPLTITDEGQVLGHLADWNSCHIGYPEGPGICTRPPSSNTDYALFHLGEIVCEGGERIPVGNLTLDTDHARGGLDARAVRKHYDNTGTAVADVRCGEDVFGIWVAGAIRPDLPVETLRDLRAAKISGDWRRINGNLELVAALSVNVPGYPIPRTEALVASAADGTQEIVALTASGIVLGDEPARDTSVLIAIEAAAALGGLEAVAEYALAD